MWATRGVARGSLLALDSSQHPWQPHDAYTEPLFLDTITCPAKLTGMRTGTCRSKRGQNMHVNMHTQGASQNSHSAVQGLSGKRTLQACPLTPGIEDPGSLSAAPAEQEHSISRETVKSNPSVARSGETNTINCACTTCARSPRAQPGAVRRDAAVRQAGPHRHRDR